MKVNLLLTGDEIMAGDIVDSNSAYIAQQLKPLGLKIHQKITVGDDVALLSEAISLLSASGDILIINGGLGPTVDDLTAEVLANTCGQALVENTFARAELQRWADSRGLPLNPANLKQAMMPEHAETIPNPVGTATGFSVNYQGCYIACTPGVPRELFAMLDQSIIPTIEARFNIAETAHTLRLQTFGIGESSLQQIINEQIGELPAHVELGFRAARSSVEIKLTSRNADGHSAAEQLAERLKTDIFPEHIFGEDDSSLAQSVVALLKHRNLLLTTAESCTGGKIAAAVTEIPGASAIFEAGFVSYSNRIKHQWLEVSEKSLMDFGAVSRAVVEEMAAGALAQSGADIAVAVSGIAGPDGGSDEKPVGTVWIAWGFKDNIKSARYHWPRDRISFQGMVTLLALDLIRREVLGLSTEACHFSDFTQKRLG